MSDVSWNTIRQQVYERASACCEYCQTCEVNTGQTMHVDHIIPNDNDALDNLCLSCWNCNTSKHKAVDAIDLESGEIVPLFNPRVQKWYEHFEWLENGVLVHGLTAIGRATIERLKMNRTRIIIARQRWVKSGFHPPD
jgi:MinD superfamily P-loop ATPase